MTAEDRFFALLDEAASQKHCIFYVNCGEGRDLITDEYEGEDLFGWLIPLSLEDAFRKDPRSLKKSAKWSDYLCFAKWHINDGVLSFTFVKYGMDGSEIVL